MEKYYVQDWIKGMHSFLGKPFLLVEQFSLAEVIPFWQNSSLFVEAIPFGKNHLFQWLSRLNCSYQFT